MIAVYCSPGLVNMASNILETIDRLKQELDALRPLPQEVIARVEQKLRIESNYHSNAIEGNSLTLGETRSLILHGLTARGKPMRDHLDIKGHDEAVKAIEHAVKEEHGLTEVFIRNLHRVLLKEPYEVAAVTPAGQRASRLISIAAYKTTPNNVITSTGETYYFTPPEQVKQEMSDLIDWYRAQAAKGEHPVIIAAIFHYRFVRIHPFDDGNGRMARLLMNLILIKHGYTVAIVQRDTRDRYLQELEQADQTEDPAQFIDYIASCCEYPLNLYHRAARGESIEDPEDIDREIALFKRSLIKGAASRDLVELKNHAKNILFPFHAYCSSKIESMASGLFQEWPVHLPTISGTRPDGETFNMAIGASGIEDLPEHSSDISIVLRFSLIGFQNQEKGFHSEVKNILNRNGSAWIISVRAYDESFSRHYSYQYDGNDREGLQRTFNGVFREMMEIMGEWSSKSKK